MSTPAYEWRYTAGGEVVHALRDARDAGALCGLTVVPSYYWLGSGSQREYERAASLRPCRRCHTKTGGRR